MLYGSVIGRKLKCLALAVAERANFNCNWVINHNFQQPH
jgi:hypothetical protein